MVKIHNQFGDIKTGRQGEAVFQCKYGEQVRRTVQPKSGIVSQAQIDHRNLYRAALDWRKLLSLPNRRYLDGYCIANWVVDGHQIPLPWSRFALKLYLERVHFVLLTKPVAGEEGEEQEFENTTTGDDNYWSIYPGFWPYQTFTPQESHQLTKVMLKMFKAGTPPITRIGIYKADDAHKPTGGELAGKDEDFGDLATSTSGQWRTINIPGLPLLFSNQEYAIRGSTLGGNSTNCAKVRFDSQNPYPRGICGFSTDQGITWNTQSGRDILFREYGIPTGAPPTPGLLHVRHPALSTVVQKRNGVTVKGYDTLSSLDEEYLTKQVGFDVQAGDIIEATTLPGISSKYVVT